MDDGVEVIIRLTNFPKPAWISRWQSEQSFSNWRSWWSDDIL